MPFEFEWFIEGHVVYQRTYGTIKLEDVAIVHEVIGQYVDQLASEDAVLHTIIDARDLEKLPFDVKALSESFKAMQISRIGWSVLVGASPQIEFVGNLIARLAGIKYRAFPTVEEAVAFLRSQDSTLPPPDPES